MPDTTPLPLPEDLSTEEFVESINRLTRDLRKAAIELSDDEARFLVDAYYAMQEDRIRAGHQIRQLAKSGEPHAILEWLKNQRTTLEKQIAGALDIYSANQLAGRWARSIVGIGPVISAGLLANLDRDPPESVGAWWRFAGLDPTVKWISRENATKIVDAAIKSHPGTKASDLSPEVLSTIAAQINVRPEQLRERMTDHKTGKFTNTRESAISAVSKRPWNASLKRLCFIIGDCFTKFSNHPDDTYGQIYKVRKELEIQRNEAGLFAAQAEHKLKTIRWKNKNSEAYKCYAKGILPPAHIHNRSHRYATKLFLSHFHHVSYEIANGKAPPKPFIFTDPRHTHFLAPPNWPLE